MLIHRRRAAVTLRFALVCLATTAITQTAEAAGPIAVVNQSSVTAAAEEPFTAALRRGGTTPELLISGRIDERTSSGERLVEAVLDIVVSEASGKTLWSGESWLLVPGKRLEWRVLIKPIGVLDGEAVASVTLRDRSLSTVESKEREAEVRRKAAAEREAVAAEREAAAVKARLLAEHRRQADIRAMGWPPQITYAVIARVVLPGMTEEQTSLAWGPPSRINRTLRASGTSEQWIYGVQRHVYFENGVVTAVHTSE